MAEIKKLFISSQRGQLTLTPLATHRIEIQDEWKNKPPVRQFPYVMSPRTQALVAGELQRLLDAGIIEHSNSEWSLNCRTIARYAMLILYPTRVAFWVSCLKRNTYRLLICLKHFYKFRLKKDQENTPLSVFKARGSFSTPECLLV